MQKDEQIKQKLPHPIPSSHPSGTIDSPVVFGPVADSTHLILVLGESVTLSLLL